ncbi:MAG: metal-dependent hydrolase [Gemmatimonadota bacterium]|nr:metal-dependent hydrolase [Gemmatimonadota bacterium]
MATLTFHGHSCFEIVAADGTRILIDPFLTGNGTADVGPEHFDDRLDYLILTHGHGDHIGDAFDILRQTGATLIATYELASYAGEVQGIEKVHPMHIGGGWDFPFGRVKLTVALHGGKIDADGAEAYTTNPAGVVVTVDGTRIYHAGDTALTMDMELLQGEVDVAILPIGDNFTMGPEDAGRAVGMIRPRMAIPMHFATFDLIDVDPERFVEATAGAAPITVMSPGEAIDV